MKKDKKQIKKDMEAKMKKKLKVKVKKKMKKIKLLLIIILTVSAIIAAIKVINMLLIRKYAKKEGLSGLKQVFSLFASTKEAYAEKISGGFLMGSYFGSLKTDFSQCEFEDGTFIALKSAFSYVSIVMPENVNIKFDNINLCSYIKQEYDTETTDESLPTVYIALKGAFSSVFISRAEETNKEEA